LPLTPTWELGSNVFGLGENVLGEVEHIAVELRRVGPDKKMAAAFAAALSVLIRYWD